MKRIVSILFLVYCSTTLFSQSLGGTSRSATNLANDLRSNMSEEDRARMKEDTTQTDVKNVPVDLKQWTIDSRFGNITPVEVDTLWSYFQNRHLNDGINGSYSHIGNLGSPRLSRIFFQREENTERFFTDPYGLFYIKPNQFLFTDTKSPYSNLTYFKAGDKLTGEDHIKAYFAINANKLFGAGFLLDYLYGRGVYNSQSTAFFNASLYAYYRGNKYQMTLLGSRYHMKMAENGGIVDDRYITNPLEMAEGERTYDPEDIPTVMDRTWNRNENWNLFFTQRYNLGFYRESEDTTNLDDEVFVPVTSFIHTADISTNERTFITHSEPDGYYLHTYLPDGSSDKTDYLSVKNTLAISLREGFNKWAQAGLTAFISHEYRRFTLPDTLVGPVFRERENHYTENLVNVGGELSRTMGRTLHYNVIGETVIAGDHLGQFSITGKGDLNFPLFKDTVRLDVDAYIKNTAPPFYFRHYHSHHYWWDDNNLSKVFRTRISGGLTIERTRTHIHAGVENIKNYTYFANTSVPTTNALGRKGYANNISVAQCGDNIQVFSATLKQDFKLGIFHLDNEVTYQKTSDADVLPLPELNLYHNFYIEFKLAKVLSMQLGADLRYFTKYYAPDYSPALGQFYQQNPNNRIEIGDYPFVNVYLNAHLKRTRFYIMMYHVNQGTGSDNYFLAPHYPVPPRSFQLGLSWNFFD